MSDIQLTLACEDYDRTRALRDGSVKPEGIDLNYVALPVEEIFWRMCRYEEFDVAELSMGAFLVAAAQGRRPFVAIPVFPSRTFRHRCIFINTASGIEKPEDLRGKRVGVPEYTMTAAVWLRGLLQHEYGVKPEEVHWLQGGEEQPGRKDRVDFDAPAGVRLEVIPQDRTLNDMLESGVIDALMSPRMPSCFLKGASNVRRLFPDYKRVEMDYFRRTGIFPIMHVVVIRTKIYEEHPWVAQSLYKAFCAAKDLCFSRLYDSNVLRISLPWTVAEYEETRQLMGEEYWPYGLAPNMRVLETLHGYLLEHGLIKQKLDLATLFAPNTREAFKI
ncbi:MAG: 4,5-dihydroxyphthalate decarboxylase [Deltaproteobacteria bacterium RIFCSPLOWO2_12_FULL_60_19]|nr:MAG: 4,5-dihydroxyphthalate decarboxylase [Deltaproteobacteria bacterium RIFCSPLOWO2_12_FULL_60_19]